MSILDYVIFDCFFFQFNFSLVRDKMLAAVSQAKKKKRFFEYELDKLRKNPDSAVAETYIRCIPVPHDRKIQTPDDIVMFWLEHDFPGNYSV